MTELDNRNILAWGSENQEKLSRLRVAVVGSGPLAQLIIASLAGLGVGYSENGGAIINIDNNRINNREIDFLCEQTTDTINKEKVKQFKKVVTQIKPYCNYIPLFTDFCTADLYRFESEIIIEATNDPVSKEKALNYSMVYRIPFLSGSADQTKGAAASYFGKEKPDLEKLVLPQFRGRLQEGYTSSVVAGLILEELRKHTFRYSDRSGKSLSADRNLSDNEIIYYNSHSISRNSFRDDFSRKKLDLKNKKILVVGSGALGNFLGISLGYLGIGKIDFLDFDTVESHNLSRQILLYGKVGEKKCLTLAERVNKMNSSSKTSAFYGKVGKINLDEDKDWLRELYETEKEQWKLKPKGRREETFPKTLLNFKNRHYSLSPAEKRDGLVLITKEWLSRQNYDLILGGVDNKFARLWINQAGRCCKLPYIDGGSGPKSGQLAVYIPGKTKCIDCQLDLRHFPTRNSCIDGPEASVVMSNSLVAGMMVGEAVNLFEGNIKKRDNLTLRYQVLNQKRILVDNEKKLRDHYC